VTNGKAEEGTGAPPEGSGAIREGARFNDLTLVRELGRGSQGIVYEAHQESLDRTVAVKILSKEISFAENQSERFRREAEAAGRLSHPNVVAVYGLSESHGHLLINQELVTGGTLDDALEERTKDGHGTTLDDCAWAAGICKALAEGLKHAHDHGVVHRDIKPGNVLLTENGSPKITDFGLAKVEDKLGLSKTGALMGTPHYMSPEQVQAVKDTVGASSDIYSLGALLYRMLTGRVPFSGESLQKVFLDILTRAPQSPRKLQPGVSADLEAVCLKALEKDPEDRYENAQEFADDLDRYLRGEPTRARPVGPIGRTARSLRRLATSTLAAVALLVPTLWVAVDALQLQRMAEQDADVHFWRLGFLALCTFLLTYPLALLGVRLSQGKTLGALPAWALTLAVGGIAGWGVLEQRTTQLHLAARGVLSARIDLEGVGNVRTIDDLQAYIDIWEPRFDADDFQLVARGFLKRKRPVLAEDWALRMEADAPQDPVTHAILLATFHSLGQVGIADQAELSMMTYAEQQKDWKAWQQVGDILRDMKRFASARNAYQEASYRPDVNRDLLNLKLAQVSKDLCQWDEAEEKLGRYIEFKPKDVPANVLGFLLAKQRQDHDAMERHVEVIANNPLAPRDKPVSTRYVLHDETGRQDQNVRDMIAALSDPATDPLVRAWWADTALALGKNAKANRQVELAQERFGQAEGAYQIFLEQDPDSLLGHLGLAFTNIQLAAFLSGADRMDRLDAAILHAARAVELDPSYDEAHLNLGIAKLRRAWEEAGVYDYPLSGYAEQLAAVPVPVVRAYVGHVADALECNGLNSDTLNDTAWVLGQLFALNGNRDDLELGQLYAERAIKLRETDRSGSECAETTVDQRFLGMANDTLAELHEKAGDLAAALKSEQAALQQEPDKSGPYAQYYRSRIEQIQARMDG
jgi:tetratricopeptide (TPR) repeat protein